MTKTRFQTAAASSVGFAALLLATAALSADIEWPAPDGFSQDLIQERYESITPALCLLKYSLEITNERSGEVSRREAYSLGVLVSPDGLIMAHGHLNLENRTPMNIKVTVGDDTSRQYDGTMLEKPDDVNITFLKIQPADGETFPFVEFDEGVKLSLGEPVLVIGLMRETFDHARAISIHRVGAVLNEPRTTYALDDAVAFGFVSGPVITRDGKVAGVVGFDLSAAEGGDIYTRSGHPLVFQTALFQEYIENPPSSEATETGGDDAWLGVFTQPLTDDLAAYWDLPPDGGIIVSTVIPGSPADKSGLRMGDVIVSFNGRPIQAKEDPDVVTFTKVVRESPLGEPLPLRLYRDGEPMEMRLTLLPRPKSGRDANEIEDTTFGLTVRELTTDVRIALNLSDEIDGVIVRRVTSGSPAALAGIRPGFVILTVGGRPVGSLTEYAEAVAAEKEEGNPEVTLFCRVGANTAFFRLQPRWEN